MQRSFPNPLLSASFETSPLVFFLESREDPSLPSNPSITLLDTIGKKKKKNLLTRILCDLSGPGIFALSSLRSDPNTALRDSSPTSKKMSRARRS
jgi:hypothetical protein